MNFARTSSSPIRGSFPLPQFDESPRPPRNMQEILFGSPNSPRRQHFIPTLPHSDAILRITGDTLCDLLDGVYDNYFDQLYIIDARFSYEYNGGHIQGAMNANSPEMIMSMFFNKIIPNSVIVFHCEFSHNRGPEVAQMFREIDRNMNIHPNLFYPHIYVLDGGYRGFYSQHQEYCEGGYVRMLDDTYRKNGELVRETALYKQNFEEFRARQRVLRPLPNALSNASLKSPTPSKGYMTYSPMVSKMLNFVTQQ
ncbi:Rhodanese-like domain containing protein [Histomonas meleagridis]|uniref:Rhodanese-like domain containing protein n=1 Tax=Histomonas meleagridis TaxID=135588 RepID=UPI00355AC7B2|nr:Rhodanese-like domain containing protein [Histomonas meleagridis]KAH0804555.1 Rhodanese-like domain containing protein [Histomonas meleagridis]